jgi:hypothetical protein
LNGSKTDQELKEETKRKRRFSADTTNDLLFWGVHLSVIGLSLAIMWVKVDGIVMAMKRVIAAQEQELRMVQKQALQDEGAAQEARNAERQRNVQFQAAAGSLNVVLSQVSEIQGDIKKTLATATEINTRVLAQSEATKSAAIQAQSAAQNAAGAASGAAGAATRAAAASGHTATVVKTRVVTTEDKLALQAQEQRLVRKQQQLTKTINRVKKNGPTLWDKLVH